MSLESVLVKDYRFQNEGNLLEGYQTSAACSLSLLEATTTATGIPIPD